MKEGKQDIYCTVQSQSLEQLNRLSFLPPNLHRQPESRWQKENRILLGIKAEGGCSGGTNAAGERFKFTLKCTPPTAAGKPPPPRSRAAGHRLHTTETVGPKGKHETRCEVPDGQDTRGSSSHQEHSDKVKAMTDALCFFLHPIIFYRR